MNKDTDACTVKISSTLQIKNEMVITLFNQGGDLLIKLLSLGGGIDVADDMYHCENTLLFQFKLHELSPF
jgi:hypothetical protein